MRVAVVMIAMAKKRNRTKKTKRRRGEEKRKRRRGEEKRKEKRGRLRRRKMAAQGTKNWKRKKKRRPLLLPLQMTMF